MRLKKDCQLYFTYHFLCGHNKVKVFVLSCYTQIRLASNSLTQKVSGSVQVVFRHQLLLLHNRTSIRQSGTSNHALFRLLPWNLLSPRRRSSSPPLDITPPLTRVSFTMPTFNSFLQVVQHGDRYPYGSLEHFELGIPVPIVLFDRVIGNVLPDLFPRLKSYNDACSPAPFIISNNRIEFQSWVDSFEKRTEVIKTMMDSWRPHVKALAGMMEMDDGWW